MAWIYFSTPEPAGGPHYGKSLICGLNKPSNDKCMGMQDVKMNL